MHYNESTDKMNKEARIPNKNYSRMLDFAAFFINASVVITMVVYFVLKEKILS